MLLPFYLNINILFSLKTIHVLNPHIKYNGPRYFLLTRMGVNNVSVQS